MESPLSRRLRGFALLVCGIASVILVLYLAFDPTALVGAHPVPLLVLLVIAAVFSFWQASVLLR
jgi:uncharacterized membrane protein YqjE